MNTDEAYRDVVPHVLPLEEIVYLESYETQGSADPFMITYLSNKFCRLCGVNNAYGVMVVLNTAKYGKAGGWRLWRGGEPAEDLMKFTPWNGMPRCVYDNTLNNYRQERHKLLVRLERRGKALSQAYQDMKRVQEIVFELMDDASLPGKSEMERSIERKKKLMEIYRLSGSNVYGVAMAALRTSGKIEQGEAHAQPLEISDA